MADFLIMAALVFLAPGIRYQVLAIRRGAEPRCDPKTVHLNFSNRLWGAETMALSSAKCDLYLLAKREPPELNASNLPRTNIVTM